MNVFLAGATGAVGRPLVRELVAAGHGVVGTTRSRQKAALIEADGGQAIVVDALDAQAIGAAVAEAKPDVVVNQLTDIQGLGSSLRRFDRHFAGTNRLRTEGNENLLAAARAAGARRFVTQSFGGGWILAHEGDWVRDEDAPFDPDPPKGMRESLAAIRRLEEVTTGARDIEGVVLRYGYFYGPGTSLAPGAEYETMLRRRMFPVIGGGTGHWSFVHVEDAASATVAALDRGAPGVYHVIDDDPAPVSEWLPVLAAAAGAPRPMRVPRPVGRLLGGAEAVALMCEARASDNAKAARELGWRPAHASWRQGLPEAFAR